MSIRVTCLILVVAALAIYAYRDWFTSLCGAILLMAVMEHPDMPKNILGVQGLNFWNILMVCIIVPWFAARRREGTTWDMPRWAGVLLLVYLGVVLVGFVRMIDERLFTVTSSSFIPKRIGVTEFSMGYLIGEYLINTVKWVIPGLLLFDGCRTPRRRTMALFCILTLFVLLALQVIRWMPLNSAFSGEALMERSRKILVNEVGYHAVNLSMILAGAFWALIATLTLVKRPWRRVGVVVAALIVAYAQVLTAGRAGYASWAAVGLVLCLLKWRKQLLWVPVIPLVVALALPGSAERMLQGFGVRDEVGEITTDDYEVTSGRTLIWPYVTEKIKESPVVGYGRLAMIRTGLRDRLWAELGEAFPHPHNAYLEMLLDNGVIGMILVMPFYLAMLLVSTRLFLDREDPWRAAVGGVVLALVLALLFASVGSQTFYPREGAIGMWCAIGLMLRLVADHQAAVARSQAMAWNWTWAQPSLA